MGSREGDGPKGYQKVASGITLGVLGRRSSGQVKMMLAPAKINFRVRSTLGALCSSMISLYFFITYRTLTPKIIATRR